MKNGEKIYDYVYLEDWKHNPFIKDVREKPVLPKSKNSYSKINKSYLGKSRPKFYRF